ncbi:MAG TPA: ADOP family duplicated permease [Terracidiphilus sp.]|nr:ADOP family duplicated permease [Terracidiphilus sp.]
MPILNRIANLFRRPRVDGEISAELESHIALRIEDNLAAGMRPEEARRDALMRFGNRTATRENVAAADSALSLDRIWFDLRYATRQLIKSPGFAFTAIVTLAVAIAANAVVFSILNSLVLRPLNLPGADRLFNIDDNGQSLNSYPDFRDLLQRNKAFDGIALYTFESAGLDTGGNPQKCWIYEASSNYFDVLGVHPFLGRFFHSTDERGPDSIPYIVLSYPYWRTHFHGDEAAIGRTVAMNRHQFTILGVAPPGFRGSELIYQADFWVPIIDQAQVEGSSGLDDRGNSSNWLIGRLKPGVTVAQATGDLNVVAAYLKKTYPTNDDAAKFSLVRPGLVGDMLGGPVRAFVAGLMLLAGLILLAACANLGSLFAARAADRSREIALRLALGSTRRRILRQLLTEALLIASAGGAAGIASSVFLLRSLSVWQPLPEFPVNVPVNPDARTYAVAAMLAIVSGLLCGLSPVRQVLHAAPWEVVKTGTAIAGRSRRFALRDVLLVVQVAVCAVLLTSSLVAVRGLARSLSANFGFQPQNTLLLTQDLNMAGYSGDRVPAMQRRILDAAGSVPGVASAGLIDNIPLGLGWSQTSVFKSGTTDFRDSNATALSMAYAISPGYLRAAGTTLLAGRDIAWSDDKNAPAVVLVNREFARKLFGSVSQAVGARFLHDQGHDNFLVIGVVEDGKYVTLTEDPKPAYFRPLLQSPSTETTLVARTVADPQAVAPALHDAVRALDASLPFSLLTWDKELTSALFAARAATVALGVLGLLGAMLAITGIFGMASYSVSKRLKEMGIRIALGAGKAQVLGTALGRAFRLLALGSVAGILLGLAATRVLAFIVYQASPSDPIVLGGTVLAMLTLGLAATWAPAQRALLADPSRLMREE